MKSVKGLKGITDATTCCPTAKIKDNKSILRSMKSYNVKACKGK